MTRTACVAGQFYPARKGELEEVVKGFLGGAKAAPQKAIAVIAPHAGYIYSGRTAGAVYSEVIIPNDVILIGPNHTGLGSPAAVMDEGPWETPLGDVEVNAALARLIIESDAGFSPDAAAHLREHSLEVQLPFIQAVNPAAAIVPIAVMHAGIAACARMGKAIAVAIKQWGKDVLIVVSSDMNHYEPEDVTRKKDALAIDEVLALEPARLLEVAARNDISMCGVIPAAIAITAARELGARNARLVSHTTSGETSGDFDAVVGYAGFVID